VLNKNNYFGDFVFEQCNHQFDEDMWLIFKDNYINKVLVMGPGQFLVAWVRSGRVSHLWFGFGSGKFPLKMSNFSIFFSSSHKKFPRVGQKSTWVKGGSASYLLRCQKYARVGSGPISSIYNFNGVGGGGGGDRWIEGWTRDVMPYR